jgi:hypothetical protein
MTCNSGLTPRDKKLIGNPTDSAWAVFGASHYPYKIESRF